MKANNNLIIYFSVSTGIGYGMLVVLSILSYSFSINIINEAKILISLLSIFFIFTGWIALALNLRNQKKNFTKIEQWKNSWIKMDIIAIIINLFLVIFFYSSWIFLNNKDLLYFLILILGLSSIFIIYFSSKIYDSFTTLPLRKNPFIPIISLLNSVSSACLVFFLIYYYFKINQNLVFYLLVIILPTTLFIKLLYWYSIKGVKNEIGIPNFYSYRGIVCILFYITPVYFVIQEPTLVMNKDVNFITLLIIIILAIIGFFLERWLFFIEVNNFNKLENENNVI